MNDARGWPHGWLSRSISAFGVVAVSWSVIAQYVHGELAVWALTCVLGAVVAWLLLIVVRVRAPIATVPLIAVMVGAGATAAPAANGVSLIPAAVAVLWLTRDIRRPVWWGACLGLVTMILLLVGAALAPTEPLGLLALEAGAIVAFLAGESRRQFLLADIRAHELMEEQSRADVLTSRQHLAHDIHDVLAHSLGGLVIQLDAVDALLDSGDIHAVAAKVRDARALAKEGLSEARRAVAALSTPRTDAESRVAGDTLVADVAALVAAHESLGGLVRLRETGRPVEVGAALALALRRAVQEGLTNARKHAPGTTVTVSLAWRGDGVTVELANPVNERTGAAGGGHGLVGMRERFSALPGGEVTSGVDRGRFVVTAHAAIVPLAPSPAVTA
jgi:signal transduction histidine kinase